jgi:hypothetical protein
MKKMFFYLLAGAGCLVFACQKHDTLPPYSASTIFQVTAKMTHTKDTIKSAGDTIFIIAQGGISDTSKTYTISATLKATDTTALANLISGAYYKTITATFDTIGLGTSGLYRWTSTLAFPMPAVAAKTKIKTTALFTYSLGLSSQTGNQTATDSKFTYAK